MRSDSTAQKLAHMQNSSHPNPCLPTAASMMLAWLPADRTVAPVWPVDRGRRVELSDLGRGLPSLERSI
jgi:hypothetical protein